MVINNPINNYYLEAKQNTSQSFNCTNKSVYI